jgi:site-specific recombinase XerD
MLFYSTGIRLSELIGLKQHDIDFYKQTIKVLGKRNKERIIPITKELSEEIANFIEMKSGLFRINFYSLLIKERRCIQSWFTIL